MQRSQRFIDGTVQCTSCHGTGKVRYLVVFRKKCPTCHGRGRLQPPQATAASRSIRELHIVPLDVHERINQKVQAAQRQRRYRVRPATVTPVPDPIIAQDVQSGGRSVSPPQPPPIITQDAQAQVNAVSTTMPPPPPPIPPVNRPLSQQHPDEPTLYVRQRRFHIYKQVAPPFHPQHPLKEKLRDKIALMTEMEGVERTWYLVKE